MRTCIVTNRSSTNTSFVRKSAPIVALYDALNFLLTCKNSVCSPCSVNAVVARVSSRRSRTSSYILVHQTGLSDSTVTQDDHLSLSELLVQESNVSTHFQQNLLPGRHCDVWFDGRRKLLVMLLCGVLGEGESRIEWRFFRS